MYQVNKKPSIGRNAKRRCIKKLQEYKNSNPDTKNTNIKFKPIFTCIHCGKKLEEKLKN